MTEEKQFSRRDFLKTTGVATGGIIGGTLLGGALGVNLNNGKENEKEVTSSNKNDASESQHDYAQALVFFTRESDFEILSEATERIFPKNDKGPGAKDLGVPYFIDKQLASEWGTKANDYRQGPFDNRGGEISQSPLSRGQIMVSGLREIDSLANDKYDAKFVDLEDKEKDNIINEFAENNVEMKVVSAENFFMFLRDLTIEGVFSDPLYGGNKNMEGWKMIQYPGAIASNTDVMGKKEFVEKDPVSLSEYQGH